MAAAHWQALPWQHTQWGQLSRQLARGRLSHALLLHGPAGLGKNHFALGLARAYLCRDSRGEKPCGHCKSCSLFAADSHPDFQQLEPEGAGKSIKVARVRDLLGGLEQTAQQGGGKCAILSPADAMNPNAANALLKSLEEPPGEALLILVSDAPHRLPATVRSRCQSVQFAAPGRAEALAWLQPQVGEEAETLLTRSHGAPLAALAWFRDDYLSRDRAMTEALVALTAGELSPLAAAAIMVEPEDPIGIDHLLDWLHRAAVAPYRGESALAPAWFESLLGNLERPLLFRLTDKVLQVKRLLLSSANPNRQLLWEELMLDWVALVNRSNPTRSDGRKRIAL